MRQLLLLLLLPIYCACLPANAAQANSPDPAIDILLDGFHAAAAAADFEDYFGRFAADGIFMGTDASERWTLAEFKAYAQPVFARGQGWTYAPLDRHTAIAANGQVAWFDEILNNSKLGRCRGTGVLTRSNADQPWRISHYSLTLLVPNSIAAEVGAQSRKIDAAAQLP
jgi:hypothetical protein